MTKVLYPNDEPEAGKHLRLLQQYFFVSCSLQHVLHIMDDLADASVHDLPERFALQLNDTHPSIGVAELMRLLVDERRLDWDDAWDITVATFGYTNHTLLPEALETWPLAMFGDCCPATSRSSTRSTAGSSTRSGRSSPAMRTGSGGCRSSAKMAEKRADGPSGHRRQPRHQRRRRAALRTAQGKRPQGLLRDVAGAVQQ